MLIRVCNNRSVLVAMKIFKQDGSGNVFVNIKNNKRQ